MDIATLRFFLQKFKIYKVIFFNIVLVLTINKNISNVVNLNDWRYFECIFRFFHVFSSIFINFVKIQDASGSNWAECIFIRGMLDSYEC